ncbi:MAG TPA: hypothetical protein VGD37_12540 [Kofleriaceae bacterium]|jgi:hypothetical protein
MKHSDQDPRRLRRSLGVSWFLVLAASCTHGMAGDGDDRPEPTTANVDPIGTWNVEYAFGPACDRPPLVEPSAFMVRRARDGYLVTAPGAAVTVTVTCTPGECQLSGSFIWAYGTVRIQQDASLVLDAGDAITGRGTELVSDGPGVCHQTFTVEGVKS